MSVFEIIRLLFIQVLLWTCPLLIKVAYRRQDIIHNCLGNNFVRYLFIWRSSPSSSSQENKCQLIFVEASWRNWEWCSNSWTLTFPTRYHHQHHIVIAFKINIVKVFFIIGLKIKIIWGKSVLISTKLRSSGVTLQSSSIA